MKSKKQSTINPILLTFAVCFLLLFKQMSVRAATKKYSTDALSAFPSLLLHFLFIYFHSVYSFIYWPFFLLLSDAYQARYLFQMPFIELVVFREPLMAEPTLNLYGTEFITCYTGHLSMSIGYLEPNGAS